MKVAVRLTVTVDRDAWQEEYGDDDSADTIRQNIRWSAADAVEIAFAHLIPTVLTVEAD